MTDPRQLALVADLQAEWTAQGKDEYVTLLPGPDIPRPDSWVIDARQRPVTVCYLERGEMRVDHISLTVAGSVRWLRREMARPQPPGRELTAEEEAALPEMRARMEQDVREQVAAARAADEARAAKARRREGR